METNILAPRYRKGKKPVKVRKPSRPIDGINHRLIREQAEAKKREPATNQDDNAPVTRDELIEKAKQLGVSFNKRTTYEVLLQRIEAALNGD